MNIAMAIIMKKEIMVLLTRKPHITAKERNVYIGFSTRKISWIRENYVRVDVGSLGNKGGLHVNYQAGQAESPD